MYPDARNQFTFRELVTDEGLAAWIVPEVWIGGGATAPNHYVDVTGTFTRKIAALRAHQSQTGHLPDLEDRLRTRSSALAAQGGLADGRLAEGVPGAGDGLSRGILSLRIPGRTGLLSRRIPGRD